MIANKHTELRIYDNLNSLLQNVLDEKEYKKKIDRNISKYIRNFVSEQVWGKSGYDVFDDLSSEYQKHAWNIAEIVEEEIFEEKKETNWLDPNVYTEEFRETLKEELVDKILERYFKVLNNQLNVYEYKNKIDSLRSKDKKKEFEEAEEDILSIVRQKIEEVYKDYVNEGNLGSKVIKNFEYNIEVREDIINEVKDNISSYLERELLPKEINKTRTITTKELNQFIRCKKAELGKEQKEEQTKIDIKVPKPIKWYAITRVWKDILK